MKERIAILLGVAAPVLFILTACFEDVLQKVFLVFYLAALIGTFVVGGAKGLGYFAGKSARGAGKVWKVATTFHLSLIYIPYAAFKIFFGGIVAIFCLCGPLFLLLPCPWVLILLNKKAEAV